MSKVALVHYTAPPTIGGVERILDEHRCLFERHGHDVEIVTAFKPELAGFDVVMIHNVLTMPFNPEFTLALRQLMASALRVRWVNWVHDVAKVNPQYAHLPWEPEPPLNCIHVAVSEVRRAEYASVTTLAEADIQVVPNGVDCARMLGLTDTVADMQLWQHDLILFHPTRIVRRKNIELGIRVTGALSDSGRDVHYIVTGAPDPHNKDHGAYMSELLKLSAELEIAHRVHFVGSVTGDDIRSLYAVCDVLFFPSTSEGFGLPLVEGALHGLPVFCSDIPPHREVAVALTEFFDLNENPAQIAKRIASHAGVMQRAARRKIHAQHDWSAIWDKHLARLF